MKEFIKLVDQFRAAIIAFIIAVPYIGLFIYLWQDIGSLTWVVFALINTAIFFTWMFVRLTRSFAKES